MAQAVWQLPPAALIRVLGEEGYRYLLQLHRHVYGDTADLDGTLGAINIEPIETLKTEETDVYKALKPDGTAGLSFGAVPDGTASFVMGVAHGSIPNGLVATEGANIGIAQDTGAKTATWSVSPQGAGSGLDADLLDARQAAQFVWSLAKAGDTALTGDITLSEGTGITLTRVGQDIAIDSSAAAGDDMAILYAMVLGK